ncbi:MAG: hypothetical protein ACYDH6_04990 [Acidimicrobiales bacterium]
MRSRTLAALFAVVGIAGTGVVAWVIPALDAAPNVQVAGGWCYEVYGGPLTPGQPVTVCP